MFDSETQLAAALLRHLRTNQGQGIAHYYAEVPLPDGTKPDLVVHRPDLQDLTCIYQTKLRLSTELLRQCVDAMDWADIVIAAVAFSPVRSKLPEQFAAAGVGLCVVGQHGIQTVHGAACTPGHTKILDYCRKEAAADGAGGFARAGSASAGERKATRQNIVAKAVEDYISENPGCRFVDVRRAVPALSRAWGNFERCARLGTYRVRIEQDGGPAKLYPREVA